MTNPPAQPFGPSVVLREGISLLQASAGTGKTWSITTIVARLVATEGLSLDKILVVTFTKAATAELRERIREGLVELLEAIEQQQCGGPVLDDPRISSILNTLDDEDKLAQGRRRLVLALSQFDQACISTIHGFCQQTLQASILESDASLDVELVENLKPLIENLVDDYWAEQLQEAAPSRIHMLKEYRIDRELLNELALQIEQDPESPFSTGLDPAILELKDPEAEMQREWSEALEGLRDSWSTDAQTAMDWVIETAKAKQLQARSKANPPYNRSQPKTQRAELDFWMNQEDLESWRETPLPACVPYFSSRRIRAWLDAGVSLPDLAIFEAADRLCAASHALTEAFVLGFVHRLRSELPRIKARAGQLSFTDLLQTVRLALRDTQTRELLQHRLRTRFQVALIDEFQDTDPVQWEVFNALFGCPKMETEESGPLLALIGDPKQAIYAFRGADLQTYLTAARQAESGRYTLDTNYRSDGALVLSINQLFDQVGIFGDPAMEFEPVKVAPHLQETRIRQGNSTHSALELLVPDHESVRAEGGWSTRGTPTIQATWSERRLPHWIAGDVLSFLQSGREIYEDNHWRPVTPGDLAILVRGNEAAQNMCKALLRAGIPAVSSSEDSVFDSKPAQALQQLLQSLTQPRRSGPARALLSGPLVGLTAIELDRLDDADWESWFERIHRWSTTWSRFGFMSAFREILGELGVLERILGQPGGEREMTDLRHVSELLHGAERRLGASPEQLLQWLTEQRNQPQRREGERGKQRLESDSDAVRIMTIHKAKGLEFGVVWLPSLWKGRRAPSGKLLRFHCPTSGGRRILELSLDPSLSPRPQNRDLAWAEELRENMRLAYVALTRARHHCRIVCGRFWGIQYSSLGNLFHGGPHAQTAQDRFSLVRQRITGLRHDDLQLELQECADHSDGRIRVSSIFPPQGARWIHTLPSNAAPLRLARFSRKDLDSKWSRGSYSSLVRGHHAAHVIDSPQGQGIDHEDAGTEHEEVMDSPSPAPSHLPLASFPRGSQAGTFLHEVLEHHDFTAPEQLPDRIREFLEIHGFESRWTDELSQGLQAALDTPLGPATGELRLSELRWKPRERLDELDFDLPVLGGMHCTDSGTIGGTELAQVLSDHAEGCPLLTPRSIDRIASLPGQPLRGFLTGQIDLVFRVEGQQRWFLADYKSNWLGDPRTGQCESAHYRSEHLIQAMDKSLYVLQYHLYTLALHRYLRWRLPDYSYERHMGGSLYLFLRGMTGELSPRDANGYRNGVFFDRPPETRIEALDRLLAGDRK